MPEARAPKLPNFFLAGALKAGTTSLYHYLAQHPQIFMSPIKEPTYFGAADLLGDESFRLRQERDRPALDAFLAGPRKEPAPLYVTEWSDYVQLFRDVRDEIAIGEASGGYFLLPCAAAALRSRIPHARLVFILRDPTEVAFSWYLLDLERDPSSSFRDWFSTQARVEGWNVTDVGRYATHLRRFLELFPREQMRVYLFDDYERDAGAVLRDVFAFLGVDPDHPVDTSVRHNPTHVPRFASLHRARMRLFAGRGAPWLPPAWRARLRRLYWRSRGHFELSPEDRRWTIDHYREEIVGAGRLLDRDLSAWLR